MKIMTCCAVALAALVPVFAPVSANAAIVDVTWTGTTLFGGNDQLGIFHFADPFQTQGYHYTATYRFDTTISPLGDIINPDPAFGFQRRLSGGTFFLPFRPSPAISSSLTINGITLDLGGSFDGEYSTAQNGISTLTQADPALDQGSQPHPYTSDFFNSVTNFSFNYAQLLDQPAHYDFTTADTTFGNFGIAFRDAQNNIIGGEGFSLRPDSVTIALARVEGGVPEPATWAMMMIGFGAIGGAMRHRRQLHVAGYQAS